VANAEHSAADFLARSVTARATALMGRQSEPLGDKEELVRASAVATERITLDRSLISPEWTVYQVDADEVEFWQGDQDRRHVRLRYLRADGGWSRTLLWP
jgi:pyridoxamine 5'-phosphate oxidase